MKYEQANKLLSGSPLSSISFSTLDNYSLTIQVFISDLKFSGLTLEYDLTVGLEFYEVESKVFQIKVNIASFTNFSSVSNLEKSPIFYPAPELLYETTCN